MYGRCPLQCFSLLRHKQPACHHDIERIPSGFQVLQRCFQEINTALNFTNCSLAYVSQPTSVGLYWPRTWITQLMAAVLPSLSPRLCRASPSQNYSGNVCITPAGGKCLSTWWPPEVTWIILGFFNIFHAWTSIFSQQLDFVEHEVPAKHIQLYKQTHRQNNRYEQTWSDITSQITFITIHIKYVNIWICVAQLFTVCETEFAERELSSVFGWNNA